MTRPTLRALAATAVLASGLLFASVPASASASPAWTVRGTALPTRFSPTEPGSGDRYEFVVLNSGDQESSPGVTLTDTLPAGLTMTATESGGEEVQWGCSQAEVAGRWVVTCSLAEALPPGAYAPYLAILVSTPSESMTGPLRNEVSVSGGGAVRAATTTVANSVAAGGTPPLGLTDFSVEATGPGGEPSTAAGAHPWMLTTSFGVPTVSAPPENPFELFVPSHNLKKVVVELPLGFAGNPLAAAARCTELQMRRGSCPAASRVGTFAVSAGPLFGDGRFEFTGPYATAVFNIAPQRGYPAEFALSYDQQVVYLYATVVHSPTGDRLRIVSPGLPAILETYYVALTIWGQPGQLNGSESTKAFLTNPTDCAAVASPARIELESWEEPGQTVSAEAPVYPQLEGCEGLIFKPGFSLLPETGEADSPTGLNVDLDNPQTAEFEESATPQLRDATVTLPAGLSADPALADGLAACPASGPEGINLGSSQIGSFGSDLGNPFATELGAGHLGGNASPYDDGVYHTAPGHCPFASTLGSAEVTSPVVAEPLLGHVYLGAPDCSPCSNQDAQEGKLIKLYLEVEGDGVIAKLPGTVSADPSTGRLTASFRENPQLPFEDLKLHFKSGPRAALSTPPTCGAYTTNSDLKPWSAPETPDASPTSSFEIGTGPGGGACATTLAQAPNAPAFTAGTLTPTAGAYSPFVLNLARADGSQRLKAIDTTLPAGLVAKLAGVGECSEAQIAAAANQSGAGERAAPSCPPNTEVGTVDVAAGAGPNPFHVSGHAYLSGPYKGAPLSLAILTPAVAGPFDLGTVVVRVALHVDPETAVVTAKSDPLPQILAGIPLDLRSVAVDLSRPNFTLNPTSCNPSAVAASVLADSSTATLSSPFQVGGCSALGFKPKLSIRLKGKTKRTGHPALRATLTMPPGGAHIGRAQVTLPHSEFLDQSHIGTVCTRVQFAAGNGNGAECPPASVYGHARAITPLLDNPIEGPVYLRSSSHKLPDLVAALGGQINVDLAGKVDSGRGGGIRNTFEVVPDAPVSKFVLSLEGGKKGLLVNSENICRKPQHAIADFTGQNGKVDDFSPLIANDCPKKSRKGHKPKGAHK